MGKSHHKGKKHKLSNLDKLEARFKKIYNSWGSTYCPTLKSEVRFNNTGWNHIITARSSMEVTRRLEILPLSKKLIETSTCKPYLSFRMRHGKKTPYWVFKGTLNNIDIVAILIKPQGIFTYLSDFEEEESIYS